MVSGSFGGHFVHLSQNGLCATRQWLVIEENNEEHRVEFGTIGYI